LSLFSGVAHERAFERAVLVYSPLWMTAVALVMLSGVLASWRDAEHLLFGVGLAVPVLILPLLPAALDVERDAPLHHRYASRAVLYVALTTLIQMYLGSYLFFDYLGMEYHFRTRWEWNRSPVFLYPLTVAYFATYYVVMQLAARWMAIPQRGARRWVLLAILSYSVAFAETAFMATPVLSEFFFYRDKHFMLIYGSICYGTVFLATLPAFLGLSAKQSLLRVVFVCLLGNAVALSLYRLYVFVMPRLGLTP
jgi:cycloeucalenol cycloisomerase